MVLKYMKNCSTSFVVKLIKTIWRPLFLPSTATARGPKKHLEPIAAPKHWMLDKLTGVSAPRPSTGPHKLRERLPLIISLRNRLKYALTGDEVKKICSSVSFRSMAKLHQYNLPR